MLGLVLLVVWSRRQRAEKHHIRQIREREERLKLALWASSEQYWDYDLRTGHMHRMWVDTRSVAPELRVLTNSRGASDMVGGLADRPRSYQSSRRTLGAPLITR